MTEHIKKSQASNTSTGQKGGPSAFQPVDAPADGAGAGHVISKCLFHNFEIFLKAGYLLAHLALPLGNLFSNVLPFLPPHRRALRPFCDTNIAPTSFSASESIQSTSIPKNHHNYRYSR
jgi:hypothetical protein